MIIPFVIGRGHQRIIYPIFEPEDKNIISRTPANSPPNGLRNQDMNLRLRPNKAIFFCRLDQVCRKFCDVKWINERAMVEIPMIMPIGNTFQLSGIWISARRPRLWSLRQNRNKPKSLFFYSDHREWRYVKKLFCMKIYEVEIGFCG